MSASSAGPSWPVAVLGPFPPYRGGIAHHTALPVRTLLPRLAVLGLSFTRLYPGCLFPGRTQFDASTAALVPPACDVRRVVDSITPHTWRRAARQVTRAGCRPLLVQWWDPFFAPAYACIARRGRRQGVRVLYISRARSSAGTRRDAAARLGCSGATRRGSSRSAASPRGRRANACAQPPEGATRSATGRT